MNVYSTSAGRSTETIPTRRMNSHGSSSTSGAEAARRLSSSTSAKYAGGHPSTFSMSMPRSAARCFSSWVAEKWRRNRSRRRPVRRFGEKSSLPNDRPRLSRISDGSGDTCLLPPIDRRAIRTAVTSFDILWKGAARTAR
jgi:hypothetical protein